MPAHAEVIIVNDDEAAMAMLVELLEIAGHIIVGQANSLESGLELARTVRAQVALLDGNLSANASHGYDGEDIAKVYKQHNPQGLVISISKNNYKWTDRPKLNGHSPKDEIVQAVTEA